MHSKSAHWMFAENFSVEDIAIKKAETVILWDIFIMMTNLVLICQQHKNTCSKLKSHSLNDVIQLKWQWLSIQLFIFSLNDHFFSSSHHRKLQDIVNEWATWLFLASAILRRRKNKRESRNDRKVHWQTNRGGKCQSNNVLSSPIETFPIQFFVLIELSLQMEKVHEKVAVKGLLRVGK